MDWTERHRPTTLADIVGNGPAVARLRAWADAWAAGKPPEPRAVILAGPPGCGKTSAALALARDMGWPAIELNASDARNADAIARVATAGAVHRTFADDGSFAPDSRKLIILDEADNLYERMGAESGGAGPELGDRGGKAQIIETIRQTQQPIVLIVNDLYALTKGSGGALKQLATTLKFTRVHTRSIPKALARIAQEEGVRVDAQVLDAIATKSEGDLRAAVRDLESLCVGRKEVGVQDLHALGARDTTASIFDVVRHILKGSSATRLRREAMDLDATPEDVVLWVDENLPKEYKDPEDLVRGYEALSRADIFLGRTRRRQDYRLWAYAGDLATVGVMAARQREYRGFTPFGFPQWLSKMSRSRSARQARDEVAGRVGALTHASRRKTNLEQMDAFRMIFQADATFAATQTHRLGLEDEEVAMLLGEQATAKRIKEVRAAATALAEAEGPKEASPKRARPGESTLVAQDDGSAEDADDEATDDGERGGNGDGGQGDGDDQGAGDEAGDGERRRHDGATDGDGAQGGKRTKPAKRASRGATDAQGGQSTLF